jgi:hypothetical protein
MAIADGMAPMRMRCRPAADGMLDIGKGIARRIEQMTRVFQRQLAFAREVQLVGCAVKQAFPS